MCSCLFSIDMVFTSRESAFGRPQYLPRASIRTFPGEVVIAIIMAITSSVVDREWEGAACGVPHFQA